MNSVAEEIAKFTQPLPQIVDYEDELNAESSAKMLMKISEKCEDFNVVSDNYSALRSENAPLLYEMDKKYAGKCISRKKFADFGGNEYPGNDLSCNDNEFCNSNISDGSVNSRCSDEYDDNAINVFKVFYNSKKTQLMSSEDESHSSESNQSDKERDEDLNEKDMIQQFSQVNVANEIEKGKAVKAQQELWYKLCECRIKMQKLLLVANRMPQLDIWENFKQKSDDSYRKDLNKGVKMTKKLLKHLVDLQAELLKSNIHTEENFEMGGIQMRLSDEDIPSDESDIEEREEENEEASTWKNATKRKLTDEEYNDVISKRHKTLESYRNSIIRIWDQKTRLTTGRISEKSFDMFDQTAVDQVKQILQDKQRLIRRTQMKRANYRVLGKDVEEEPATNVALEMRSTKELDPEIFDDEDFYRQLLKDIIENKSVGIDPVMFSKQLEIQRARSKIKHKVDTKASKGRKIRFDVHPKLANFMAPVINTSMTSDAKDELFRSLFGQHREVSDCISSNEKYCV